MDEALASAVFVFVGQKTQAFGYTFGNGWPGLGHRELGLDLPVPSVSCGVPTSRTNLSSRLCSGRRAPDSVIAIDFLQIQNLARL